MNTDTETLLALIAELERKVAALQAQIDMMKMFPPSAPPTEQPTPAPNPWIPYGPGTWPKPWDIWYIYPGETTC